MKNLIVFLSIFWGFKLIAQETKNHIGVNLLGKNEFIEIVDNSNANNHYWFVPKGISYIHDFSKFSVRTGINYYDISVEANSNNCSDCLVGSGKLKGIEIKAGLQKNFYWKIITFFIGVDVYYLPSKYSGTYYGGFSGGGYKTNQNDFRIGLNPFIGIGLRPLNRFQINWEAGYIRETIHFNDKLSHRKYSNSNSDFSKIQSLVLYYNF